MGQAQEKNWCEDFYDDHFAEHHLVRTDQRELDNAVSFLQEKLCLKPGNTIFDQCCGIGSLSIALAARGYKMTGVDLIPSYIARAQHDAMNAGIPCHFESGDAHAYIAPEQCDGAINWWTSFGYAPDDRKNMEMLRCVHKSLKPGGRFALDYMNASQRLREFGGKTCIHSETKKNGGTSTWESRLDHASNMIIKKWRYQDATGRKFEKQGGGAKLYTKNDLKRMFATCGFDHISFYGSVGGETLAETSPRCIVVAEKI